MACFKSLQQLRKCDNFFSRSFSKINFNISIINENMNRHSLQFSPLNKIAFSPVKNYRKFTTSRKINDNYEGDGKTTVTILNREYKHLVMIDSYSNAGFRLNNGIYAIGPLAAFPRSILHWNVNCARDLTPESFSLFCLLDPKIDILIIGTGNVKEIPGKECLELLKSCKISAEILPTDKAVSLFNFLNAEGRCIAGAFIPPTLVTPYEDELKLLHPVEAIDNYNDYPSPKIES